MQNTLKRARNEKIAQSTHPDTVRTRSYTHFEKKQSKSRYQFFKSWIPSYEEFLLSTLSEANIQDKDTDIMTPSSNDPAEARKRRKEIIQSQRSENESIANGVADLTANGSTAASSTTNGTIGKHVIVGADADAASDTATDDANSTGAEKKPPKKRKVASGDSSSRKSSKIDDDEDSAKSKKTQIRYDPDVPMSKDQLAAWRREARRVRNRESAAASRQRIRNRISELEDEVGDWKAKYSHAIRRLEALEKCISAKANNNAEQLSQQDLVVLASEQEQPASQPGAPSVAPAEGTKDSASAI